MAEAIEQEKSVVGIARGECVVLSTILDANRRPHVYRHHRFYRRSRHAALLAAKCFNGKGARQSRPVRKGQLRTLLHLQRSLVRAAEACAAELAASRVDTAALALACLAAISRLGCCVGRSVVASTDAVSAALLWPASFVEFASTRAAEAVPTIASHEKTAPVRKESYGGLLNTLTQRREARKKKPSIS